MKPKIKTLKAFGRDPWLWRTGYVVDGIAPAYVIFPNPSRDEISITLNDKYLEESPEKQDVLLISSLRVLDKMGKSFILRKYPDRETVVKLNISSLPKGIYLLRINDRESHTILKE